MVSPIIMSDKKIIAKYLGVVKSSFPLPSFRFDHDTSTFSKFTLLTFTLSYTLIYWIHDNCNTEVLIYSKKVKFYQKPKSLVVVVGET